MLGVFIALGVQCFVVYMLLLKVFTGLNPIKFIKKLVDIKAIHKDEVIINIDYNQKSISQKIEEDSANTNRK